MPEAAPGQNWEFDGFTMLTEMRLLLSQGVAVPLTPKAFDTLRILITNRDRVVTKDELLRLVWPDVVVEEGNLTQQIFLLRKALGESAQQSRYIITVPGRGYRFTARVTAISGGAPLPPAASSDGGRPIGRGYLAMGGVALLAIVLGVAWRVRDEVGQPLDLAKARVTKITESGKAIRSAASADGRYVAYVEDHGDQHSLWVRTAGGGRREVLARHPSVLSSLTFSNDGEYLYFTRQRRGFGKIRSLSHSKQWRRRKPGSRRRRYAH
jgi:DNA-binding winged helix-turn-helix (wHTH) protein